MLIEHCSIVPPISEHRHTYIQDGPQNCLLVICEYFKIQGTQLLFIMCEQTCPHDLWSELWDVDKTFFVIFEHVSPACGHICFVTEYMLGDLWAYIQFYDVISVHCTWYEICGKLLPIDGMYLSPSTFWSSDEHYTMFHMWWKGNLFGHILIFTVCRQWKKNLLTTVSCVGIQDTDVRWKKSS